MKSITEFAHHTLQKVLAAKTQLLSEGKSPEEIAQSVGESFKLEGDKLKFILAAADLIVDKTAVRRVMVVSFAEGESAPAKYQKIEENHYLVETIEPVNTASAAPKGGHRGKKRDGPKSTPWGASPEEKAAKNKASAAAQAAAKK